MPASGPVSWELDKRAVARVRKLAEQYRGKPLQRRMEKAALGGARLLVNPIRAKAPVYAGVPNARVKPGATRASIKARQDRLRGGFIRGAKVGPTVRFGAPLIRGHRLVAWGNPTPYSVPPNAFVDEAIGPHLAEVVKLVSDEFFSPK